MKKVLVVTYGGGHARMLKPVIARLRDAGLDVHVLALNTAAAELSGMGVTVFGYHAFFGDSAVVTAYGEKLAQSLDKVINHDETVAYLGANFRELVETHGAAKATQMYETGGRYIFEPVKAMETILRQIAPDILLTTNSPRSEKCATLAARKLGIKSVAFIDMFGIRCASWFKDNGFADKVLVLSKSVKDYFVSLGRDPESIVIVGNPAFDQLATAYRDSESNIIQHRKDLPFTVLWASQPEPVFLPETLEYGDPELPVKIETVLNDIFERHPDWQLIVRNHPSEVERSYPPFAQISTQADPFDTLLKGVHVVLTPSSTVGFQGIIMGTKLVTIDRSVLTPTLPYAKMGYSTGLTELADIEPTLEGLAQNKDTYTAPPYRTTDAASRATDAIIQLLQSSER